MSIIKNKVTIKDVARRAGVSPATASRVSGKYGYASKAVRRKVQAAIQELGYHPNFVARSMVTKDTRTLGLIVTDITNPFFAQLMRSVEDIAWEAGYTLFLANSDENPEREAAIIQTILERQVDGLILVPASSQSTPYLEHFLLQGIPLVLLDRNVKGLAVDAVMVDNEAGAHQAVSYLIRLGHRHIGMVIDNLDISTNAERLAGYRRAFLEADLVVDEQFIQSCQFTEQSAFNLTVRMLSNPHRPTALFAANNFMTLGILRAARETHLRIPEDIALVGFDDLDWTAFSPLQLTAVAQPVQELGSLAARRLLMRLQGDQMSPMEIRLNTKFIIRKSCGE
jgi:LacI family transcriptional regulator, galactose operon repressor